MAHHSCRILDRDGVINAQTEDSIRRLMEAKPDCLPTAGVTPEWLEQWWPVWCDFFRLTNVMRTEGRGHYSARRVLFVLRWRRALDASCDSPVVPSRISSHMARLYNAVTGLEFFKLRS